jgi:polysaccharide biosynthesis/export protein
MARSKMIYQNYPVEQPCQKPLADGGACVDHNPKRKRGSAAASSLPSLTLRVVMRGLGTMACFALLALAGCQGVVNPYDARIVPPVPEEMAIGREQSKVSLPAYRIEPPDVVSIEMLKLIPLPPYRAEVFDVLQIRANAPPDQPIDNYYMIEAEGTINLGPQYGSVRVAGMTIDEIKSALDKWLRQYLNDPSPSVQLARVSGAQPVTGQYLVGPDGSINLRQYGVVPIAGKTVTEARIAIEKHLKQFLDSPQVAVEVLAYNSKTFYVITQGGGLGDSVRRLPVTGNDTVLDAVSQINGLSQVSSKKMWIARPAPHQFGCQQILPIDWDGIAQGAKTDTNYQLLPGDRLFIAEDELLTFANVVSKVTAPIERIAGIAGLGSSTIRGFQTMGRGYNRNRNGI